MPSRALFSLAFILCLTRTLYAQQTVSTGSIQGILFSAGDKKPLADINVWLEPEDQSISRTEWLNADHTEYIIRQGPRRVDLSAKTDSEGSFFISGVPPGPYYVMFLAFGYILPQDFIPPNALSSETTGEARQSPAFVQKVTVSAGRTAHVELPIERGGIIEGTVTYADGRPAYIPPSTGSPVGGMPVSAWIKEPNGTFAPPAAIGGYTDKNGHFLMKGMPAASYVVYSWLPSEIVHTSQGTEFANGPLIFYGRASRPSRAGVVTITGAETVSRIDIILPVSGLHVVRGRVEAPNRSPITFGRVVMTPTGEYSRLASRTTYLREDGTFQFDQVPNDTYSVSIRFEPQAKSLGVGPGGYGTHFKLEKPAYAAAEEQVTVNGEDPAPLVFRLHASQ